MAGVMYRVPSLEVNEPPVNIDPILRLIKNKKESTLTAFPYDSRFVKALLKDVHVMAIGDSLMRSIYKDLIVMLHGDDLIEEEALRAKTETSFLGDRQIDILPLENDRVFRQAREYQTNYNLIQYLFTTRVMKNDIDVALLELWSAKEFPDVLLINSCLWDITRYSRAFDPDVPSHINKQAGVERAAIEEFLERISMLIRRLRLVMPPTTQVIWINMPWPLTVDGRSIVNRADNAETRHLNRMLIVDANFRASQLFRAAGYDVLDIGFYMRNQALYSYRIKDGVHWDSVGTRIMTQLVIGHLARSWNITLPLRIKQKIAKYADEACTFDTKKSWAAYTLMGFDLSTISEDGSDNVSFPEAIQALKAVQKVVYQFLQKLDITTQFIQQRIRERVLREIKDNKPELYSALRRDILTMRLFKLLDENPDLESRIMLEDRWKISEMAKAFPSHAAFTNGVVPQELTVRVDEEAVSKMNRKRKHSIERREAERVT